MVNYLIGVGDGVLMSPGLGGVGLGSGFTSSATTCLRLFNILDSQCAAAVHMTPQPPIQAAAVAKHCWQPSKLLTMIIAPFKDRGAVAYVRTFDVVVVEVYRIGMRHVFL